MNILLSKTISFSLLLFLSFQLNAQNFQGKAYYMSKTTIDMSNWGRGRQMSEQQKKQMMDRMRQWLERTYILTFNKEESIYKEDEKLEAPGSRGSSMWGSSFSTGPQYKNVKSKIFLQDQEFFGKKFLITENLKPLEWKMGTETKQIGQYTCFKATTLRPATEVNYTSPQRPQRDTQKENDSLSSSKENNKAEEKEEMVEVIAWYTPMIPINQGPADYWGLPGLILEVSAGNVTMLCSKIVMNPEEKIEIKSPEKGQEVTKQEYHTLITEKMEEMRNSRGRRGGRRF